MVSLPKNTGPHEADGSECFGIDATDEPARRHPAAGQDRLRIVPETPRGQRRLPWGASSFRSSAAEESLHQTRTD